MKEKILLDTDIGSDIDDAICLAYLLAQPRCELLGITTVTGDVTERARMASALCQVAGKQIPIYPGASQPLLVAQRQPDVPQAATLPRWAHAESFPAGEAVEFMRRTIYNYPHEVTLLGIGPLTNIALLFSVDPEIPRLLKQLVLMCGRFTAVNPQARDVEWNAMLDPHATAMVYRAALRVHRSIGLDVTTQVTMSIAEVHQRFSARLLQPVLDFAAAWFRQYPGLTYHDPLAAAIIFDDQICGFEDGKVSIDLEESPGKTHWQTNLPEKPHQVATSVNPQRFFDHFFSVLT